ncbi:hypothetical protein AUTU_45260 (plasmid) [Aureibacter tunicatorum]|nr:hypothetical protein AUTU_45260 [Aureibacter tunicatorum]
MGSEIAYVDPEELYLEEERLKKLKQNEEPLYSDEEHQAFYKAHIDTFGSIRDQKPEPKLSHDDMLQRLQNNDMFQRLLEAQEEEQKTDGHPEPAKDQSEKQEEQQTDPPIVEPAPQPKSKAKSVAERIRLRKMAQELRDKDVIKAYKSFQEFRRSSLKQRMNRFQKTSMNNKFSALDRKLKKNGDVYGSEEFIETLRDIFPEVRWEMTVPNVDEYIAQIEQEESEARDIESQESSLAKVPESVEQSNAKTGENAESRSKTKEEQEAEAVKNKVKALEEAAKKGENTEAEEKPQPEAVEMDKSGTDGYANSLMQQPPMSFIEEVRKAPETANELHAKESKEAQESLPEIKTPTGIEAKEKPVIKKPELPQSQTLDLEQDSKEEKTHMDEPEVGSTRNVSMPSKPKAAATDDPEYASRMKDAISSIPNRLPSVNTDPGPTPQVSLTGASDPAQQDKFVEQAEGLIAEERNKAMAAAQADFGENDIAPTPDETMLKASQGISEPQLAKASELQLQEVSLPEVNQAFDRQAHEKLQADLQEQKDRQAEAQEELQSRTDQERQKFDKKLDDKITQAAAKQSKAKEKAEADTKAYREEWEAENQARMEEYDQQVEQRTRENQEMIDREVNSTQDKAQGKMNKARADADKKVKEANNKAQTATKEAQEDKSWWDQAVEFVESVFDSLKKALNSIFEGLRTAVKAIMKAVKEAVVSLIEAARVLVVNLIKAFGEILKSMVNTLLAAFPAIAQRFCDLIDQAVEIAEKAVNKIAAGLKAAASFLIDVLAKAIDTYLAAYQAIFNFLLEAVEFIAVGMLRILEKITNLVLAAQMSPDFFLGQMSEELLGSNIMVPLPNEIVMAKGGKTGIEQASIEASELTKDQKLLEKSPYDSEDFKVDPVVQNLELSPELMAQLQASGDGVIEFDSGKNNSLEEVKSEVSANAKEDPSKKVDLRTDSDQAVAYSENNIAYSKKDVARLQSQGMVGPFNSPGERSSHLVGQITSGVKKLWDEKWPIIVAAIVGGILGLILANILTGGAIMAALPLIIQIVGAAFAAKGIYDLLGHFKEYLSSSWVGQIAKGGKHLARALAALAIEAVFALMFGGKAAFKAIKSGAKSIAKNGVKASVKSGAKLAKNAVKNSVKSTAKAGKELGQVALAGAKTGFRNTIKGGKFLLKGIQKGAVKGAKSFKQLAKKLGDKLKFDKYRFTFKNRRFKLEGHLNPWVLLANGEVEYVDQKDLTRSGSGRLGDSVIYKPKGADKGRHGYVIGEKAFIKDGKRQGSAFVEDARKAAKNTDNIESKELYQSLKDKGSAPKGNDARYKYISNKSGQPRNPKFRSNYFDYLKKTHGIELSDTAKRLLNVHHIVPNFIKGEKEIAEFLKAMKFNIDELENAIGLPTVDLKSMRGFVDDLADASKKINAQGKLDDALKAIKDKHKIDLDPNELDGLLKELKRFEGRSVHEGYHTAYSKAIKKSLEDYASQFNNTTSKAVQDMVKADFQDYINNIINKLKNGEIELP